MAEQLSINPKRTAILIMDYQNRQLSNFSGTFQHEILEKANMILAKARLVNIPIVYIEVLRGERTPETEIHPAITPQSGETVLTKSRVGPFSTTNLDELLKKQGAETLILMGISTSGCVLSTVRWAADIDYQLVVISDCCADPDAEVHRILIEKVFPWHGMATIASSQEFIQALG